MVATGERVFVPGRSLSPTETVSSTTSEPEGVSAGTSASSLGSEPSDLLLSDPVANEIMAESDASIPKVRVSSMVCEPEGHSGLEFS